MTIYQQLGVDINPTLRPVSTAQQAATDQLVVQQQNDTPLIDRNDTPPPAPSPAPGGSLWLILAGVALGVVAISAARKRDGMNGLDDDSSDCGCGG